MEINLRDRGQDDATLKSDSIPHPVWMWASVKSESVPHLVGMWTSVTDEPTTLTSFYFKSFEHKPSLGCFHSFYSLVTPFS